MRDEAFLAYGRHVIVDIFDTPSHTLNDLAALENALVRAAVEEGVTVLGILKHAFEPSGVTILLLLAESHVSLHTYPDEGKAFFDAFTCGVRHEPLDLFRRFAERSALRGYKIRRCERGNTDMHERILTGITTTGIPHLGNYVGAIRPAITASSAPGVESFFFLADYHGLIKCDDPVRLSRSRVEIAAAWLAAGLDPERTYFYRQSDVPETLELYWLLTCVAPKGLMNRAHAYKAATDSNEAEGEDIDAGVTMGLFCYPILMAADILLFSAHKVPVGRDQLQHLEMTRDIAQRFNQLFGNGKPILTLPEAVVGEQAVLPGLDGRKMSKSYGNTIPLFAGGRDALAAGVMKIVTDSKLPGEPKDPDANPILTLYSAFANADAASTFRAELASGLGWGEAKSRLVECIERELAPMRERYEALMGATGKIEDILQAGAEKARALARPLLEEMREAVGLRGFSSVRIAAGAPSAAQGKAAAPSPSKPPAIRQYRESDGTFHFKLVANGGTVLLQGGPFESGAEAGRSIRALRETKGDMDELPMHVRVNGELSGVEVEAGLAAWIESSGEQP